MAGFNVTSFADALDDARERKPFTFTLTITDQKGNEEEVGQIKGKFTPGLMTARLEESLGDIRRQSAAGILFSLEMIDTYIDEWDVTNGTVAVDPKNRQQVRDTFERMPEFLTQIALQLTQAMQVTADPKSSPSGSRRSSSTAPAA